jgi:NAD(P)-dependent dehydrogenase (short-subunit alcohol dehydrogenase family)
MSYLKSLFNVDEKVIVITGGSGTLGSEMARGFLNAGAKVVLLGTDENKLNGKVSDLKKSGGEKIIGLICNVLDEENIRVVNNQIVTEFNRIDVLINAAGGNMTKATIGIGQNIFDMNINEFRKVTDLNLIGTVLPTMIFGKTIADQKSGSIINISSMASTRVITRVVGYSAAKAGVENFTRWMAVEMAHKFGSNIRVNAIAPGFLLTDQNKNLLTKKDGSLTDRGKTIIDITPFKRFGEPDELIGTALWLASDASKFVTGIIIPIDGGFLAFSGV